MYIRLCPNCNEEINYAGKYKYLSATTNNSFCKKCKYIKTSKSVSELWASGSLVGFTSKSHTDASKKLMSESIRQFWNSPRSDMRRDALREYMSNRTISDETKHKISIANLGANNPKVKSLLTRLGISEDEYNAMVSDKERYYKLVRRITESQPLHMLENFDKRGKFTYHLDHIIPIIYGFLNNIDPLVIGDISNLRMIPCKENLKKSSKYLEE